MVLVNLCWVLNIKLPRFSGQDMKLNMNTEFMLQVLSEYKQF
jgi:hypothetical protein